ncbi:uncharacterized protein LOC142612320 [Castanea sativa]|uniref:uncharacterized protein LOC142612320 n=1 Tax=Castanea sativa TaxID=21020 RepID=UPI003F64EDEF
MYLDLYKGLRLRPKDLTCYDSPLVGFDGKTVIPKGQIRLPVQSGSKVVKVDFIVVDAYSFYTAIVARPWLHAMRAVSSTLHLKVKYPFRDQLEELVGSQSMQPPRCLFKEHSDAVKEEVLKLKQTGAIKEVFYPEWLANTVVMKKKNGKWRVCLNFTNINKACPKDYFHMARIDQLVDATVDHSRISFLDAFQGYHQMPLALHDQEKTAFVTPTGNYHYRVMPFGLKNAGSTYQRMMTRMFEPQLGKNMEIYIDDMVVKSKVSSGKFLGYMVAHHRIEVDPNQIRAINNLQPPWNPKEVQRLIGMTRPVYYVIKSLHEVEVRSLPLEKAILAVVHATWKLPHYFQVYIVVVLAQLPLQLLLRKANYTRRIVKWGTILGPFDIKYMPRTFIKGQVLADLVAEFAEPLLEENGERQNIDEKSVGMVSIQEPLAWKLYVDGASNQRGTGVGLVVVSLEKIIIEKSLRLGFSIMNNEVEYDALLVGMAMVQKMGGKNIGRRLVVGQVKGELKARDLRM